MSLIDSEQITAFYADRISSLTVLTDPEAYKRRVEQYHDLLDSRLINRRDLEEAAAKIEGVVVDGGHFVDEDIRDALALAEAYRTIVLKKGKTVTPVNAITVNRDGKPRHLKIGWP